MASAPNTEQWPRISTVLPVRIDAILTISLYASLLSLGVSLMVPMNTKNKPKAKERATRVTVLGEAIFLPSVCTRRFPSELKNGRFLRKDASARWGVGFWKDDKHGGALVRSPLRIPVVIFLKTCVSNKVFFFLIFQKIRILQSHICRHNCYSLFK